MQSTPLGPWGVGASAGPATAGLQRLWESSHNPDHTVLLYVIRGGKGLTLPIPLTLAGACKHHDVLVPKRSADPRRVVPRRPNWSLSLTQGSEECHEHRGHGVPMANTSAQWKS